MTRKKKPIPLTMVDALNKYQATGRIVTVYPYKGQMSLNGHKAISYKDAHNKMLDFLNR